MLADDRKLRLGRKVDWAVGKGVEVPAHDDVSMNTHAEISVSPTPAVPKNIEQFTTWALKATSGWLFRAYVFDKW